MRVHWARNFESYFTTSKTLYAANILYGKIGHRWMDSKNRWGLCSTNDRTVLHNPITFPFSIRACISNNAPICRYLAIMNEASRGPGPLASLGGISNLMEPHPPSPPPPLCPHPHPPSRAHDIKFASFTLHVQTTEAGISWAGITERRARNDRSLN